MEYDQNGRRPKTKTLLKGTLLSYITTTRTTTRRTRTTRTLTQKITIKASRSMGIDSKSDQSITRLKIKTTSPKMEDDQNGRRPKWKTTKMEDDQNGRRPKWKTTKMEDDQNGR